LTEHISVIVHKATLDLTSQTDVLLHVTESC